MYAHTHALARVHTHARAHTHTHTHTHRSKSIRSLARRVDALELCVSSLPRAAAPDDGKLRQRDPRNSSTDNGAGVSDSDGFAKSSRSLGGGSVVPGLSAGAGGTGGDDGEQAESQRMKRRLLKEVCWRE